MDKTITMFCANEQAETAHTLDVDGNAEVVLTCGCGRFTKLPANTDATSLAAFIDAHKIANEGQISQESIDKKKEELIAQLAEANPADVGP